MRRKLLFSLLIILTFALSAMTTMAQERPVVTIYGAYTTGADQDIFMQDLTAFADANNIDIVYEGDADFESNVAGRIADNTPDIVGYPQPALLLANASSAVDLRDVFEMSYLQSQYNQSYIDLTTTPEGKVAGIWGRSTLKSLVWYSPSCFANSGYNVPSTWEQLINLTDQIVADGKTPWVVSMESGDLTGDAGTDWLEDILLRTTTLENYDRWTTLSEDTRLPFASKELRRAWDIMGYFLMTPNHVLGGTDGMLSQPTLDTGLPLLDCSAYLAKYGSDLRGLMLDDQPDLNIAPDGDLFYFYFPAIDVQYGLPALVGGEAYALYSTSDEARLVMEFLSTPDSLASSMAEGVYLAPHLTTDLRAYPDAYRPLGEILLQSTVVRFDGSAVMPTNVGLSAFPNGIVDYLIGVDMETILGELDSAFGE